MQLLLSFDRGMRRDETLSFKLSLANSSQLSPQHFHVFAQGMTGEGWVWLASDKVTAASLRNEPTLQEALGGLVGLTVKGKIKV